MSLSLIETVRVRDGEAPLWGLHLRRLVRSCRALGVPFPPEFEVPAGGHDRIHRLQVSAQGVDVTERPVGSTAPVHLVTSRVVHRPYPHKTTDRAQFNEAMKEARLVGADDAILLTPGGYVAETAIWGLFWWEGDGDRPCAPALELEILPGVARERIGELVGLAERKVGRPALNGCALFVANAARGILQVATLDEDPVPPSPKTAALAARFWA
jgi:branched-subunit amino acid aminotransferase/4-amino-4-deoxychorismate lyase